MDIKKLELVWTEPAISDLKQIFQFYNTKSKIVAKKIITKLKNRPKSLLINGFEKSGQIDDINSNYRHLIVQHYKILYRISEDKIIISRIFDTRQNPDKLSNL
jgi:plasmid stabilization system protein ParE